MLLIEFIDDRTADVDTATKLQQVNGHLHQMFSLQNSIGTIHAQVKPIKSSDSPNTIVDTSRVATSKCPVANGGLHRLPNTAVRQQTNKLG